MAKLPQHASTEQPIWDTPDNLAAINRHAQERRDGKSPPLFSVQYKAQAPHSNFVEPPPARALVPIELGQFLETEIPKPADICGDLLREGSLGLFYGPAGVCKTWLLLWLAVAVAYAESFLGFAIKTARSVLYIDGEMTAYEMQERLRLLSGRLRETTSRPFQPLQIVTPDLQPDGIPKIDTPEGQLAVLRLCELMPDVRLIIFDNLSCLTNPDDDNSSASWSAVQELLLQLRRRGVAAIVGHHAAKGGQQRGTSRRTDILDLVLKLEPVGDGIVDGRTRVNISFEKGRSLKPDQKQPLTATLEPHPDGGLMWTKGLAQIPVAARVRSMLLDGMPPGDVAEELKTARSYVYRVKNEMQESGELPANSRGQRQNPDRVVPLSPSLRRGQGTNGVQGTRDRYKDK